VDESIESQVKQANRDYHNNLDPGDYHENPSIFDRDRQREIRQTLQSIANPDGRLLDVGCGTGNILRWGSQFFRRVSGTDISENMLELARREVPGADYYLSDASQLPFGNNTFDAVTFYATLHHFPSPVKFLEEALRGLYLHRSRPELFSGSFLLSFFQRSFLRQTGVRQSSGGHGRVLPHPGTRD